MRERDQVQAVLRQMNDRSIAEFYAAAKSDCDRWHATRTMRLLVWLEGRTGGAWPWGEIWLGKGILRGWSFHFASGYGGFVVSFPMPRWLPGFVRDIQIDGPLRFWRGEGCPWWRESDLHGFLPVLPLGKPFASRTRRLRGGSRSV